MEDLFDISDMTFAVDSAIDWTKEGMELFTTAPAVYFVAFAIIGAAAGVARRFVPMKKR